jgi:hypothetical protein
LTRIRIRILPLISFQIWTIQSSKRRSKASNFSLWRGSGSCFSLCYESRSSFPLWCWSGCESSFPKGSGSATLAFYCIYIKEYMRIQANFNALKLSDN